MDCNSLSTKSAVRRIDSFFVFIQKQNWLCSLIGKIKNLCSVLLELFEIRTNLLIKYMDYYFYSGSCCYFISFGMFDKFFLKTYFEILCESIIMFE